MVETLRKQAKVEIMIPLKDEAPKAVAPAPVATTPAPAATATPATAEPAKEAAKPVEAEKAEPAKK